MRNGQFQNMQDGWLYVILGEGSQLEGDQNTDTV
jgi:hypothetical protein